MMENIKLENGKYLNRDYGKYRPNLTFISDGPLEGLGWEECNTVEEWNVHCDTNPNKFLRGQYRKSLKGTDVFDLTKSGDILLKIDWGGSFNSSRGTCDIPEEDRKYFRRASSNGGGIGNTYIVFSEGYKRVVREEDI